MATAEANNNDAVQVLVSEPQIPVIPFAITLPTSTLQSFDDPLPKGNSVSLMGNNGIVGSIVLLRNSAVVWVGWGTLGLTEAASTKHGFGKGTWLLFGALNLK
jgi:hypothetical protein